MILLILVWGLALKVAFTVLLVVHQTAGILTNVHCVSAMVTAAAIQIAPLAFSVITKQQVTNVSTVKTHTMVTQPMGRTHVLPAIVTSTIQRVITEQEAVTAWTQVLLAPNVHSVPLTMKGMRITSAMLCCQLATSIRLIQIQNQS